MTIFGQCINVLNCKSQWSIPMNHLSWGGGLGREGPGGELFVEGCTRTRGICEVLYFKVKYDLNIYLTLFLGTIVCA